MINMKTVIVLVCLFIATTIKVTSSGYTREENVKNVRVIGGHVIDSSEALYAVAILIPDGFILAAGSILNRNMILTVAHISDYIASYTCTVRVGSKRHNRYGQRLGISSFIPHPNFDNNNGIAPRDYDVAIILLDESIDIDYINTRPIQLPPPIGLDVGLPVDVTGWGGPIDQNAYYLVHRISIEVLSQTQCTNVFGNAFTARMFCSGDPNLQKQVCQYDQGDPLVLQGTNLLLGILSLGNNCSSQEYPTAYTNIAHPNILSFIKTTITNNSE